MDVVRQELWGKGLFCKPEQSMKAASVKGDGRAARRDGQSLCGVVAEVVVVVVEGLKPASSLGSRRNTISSFSPPHLDPGYWSWELAFTSFPSPLAFCTHHHVSPSLFLLSWVSPPPPPPRRPLPATLQETYRVTHNLLHLLDQYLPTSMPGNSTFISRTTNSSHFTSTSWRISSFNWWWNK